MSFEHRYLQSALQNLQEAAALMDARSAETSPLLLKTFDDLIQERRVNAKMAQAVARYFRDRE